MYVPFLSVSRTGSRVADELYQLVATLIVLRLLSLNFPLLFQLDFSLKAVISSVPLEYKRSVESAVEFVKKLNGRYPSVSARLELGYSWLEAVDKLLQDCCL